MIKSVPKLIDAATAAFNNTNWSPTSDGTTFCNRAVAFIASSMGYADFSAPHPDDLENAILANDIIDRLNDPNGDWMQVDGEIAQERANDGELVIAGMKNPQGHGHVAVVIPGSTVYSGNWGKNAPKIMNIGKDVFIGKKASYAFQTEPQFFILKEVT